MRYVISRFVVLVLTACIAQAFTVSKSDRVNTPLQACEFNSIASNYLPRPTSVALEVLSKKHEVLMVQMTPYARSNMFPDGYQIRLSKSKVPDYVALIEKFLQWSDMATERGDQFTKEIGQADSWRKRGKYKFTFHSGNASNHYLVITWVFMGTSTDESSLCFNPENADILRQLLIDYSADKLTPTDIDSVYN